MLLAMSLVTSSVSRLHSGCMFSDTKQLLSYDFRPPLKRNAAEVTSDFRTGIPGSSAHNSLRINPVILVFQQSLRLLLQVDRRSLSVLSLDNH
jgi:hypothetical protein